MWSALYCWLVAPQLSFLHVYDGGLIGLDNACIHADNTFVSCMDTRLPIAERANCTKVWHHSWVHDCREKGVRGDDQNVNLSIHHLVVYNNGEGRDGGDRNIVDATGVIVKGDYNKAYQLTIFNTSGPAQGDLCMVTKGRPQQNAHSIVLNTVAKVITNQGGPVWPKASFRAWNAVDQLSQREMKLRDVANFDFRPLPDSPLRGTGVVHEPEVPRRSDGKAPDVGAYQADDVSPWIPGCTFHESCAPPPPPWWPPPPLPEPRPAPPAPPRPSPPAPPPSSDCEFVKDVDYQDGVTRPKRVVGSAAECCGACKASTTCVVAVLVQSSGECFLKPNTKNEVHKNGTISCKPKPPPSAEMST